ncbi:hypothetical protein HYH03_000109 [Edaphochlamys debaryana]|uniref:Uncharacterized protein n=1 Tax=Edaphochlamys debaryana TaxID=47281 RepID=A0A835YPR4_9CHLO|nr:hypothetical protein HYH03_000109 [Edaphochlamys debaryana]|eukprot:KAG2501604.1 hypothetical protein HYH03_000109 [Edaphochlamys debaryana]
MQTMLRSSPSAIGRCSSRTARSTTSIVLGRPAVGIVNRGLGAGACRAAPEQKTPPKVPGEDELPPWVRREKERELQAKEGSGGLPWPLYLLFSIFVAIAAVGSVFEFLDGNAIAGVIPKDSPLWAPILLFFATTGLPTAGYLFIQGVTKFNEAAERQDKLDGYL